MLRSPRGAALLATRLVSALLLLPTLLVPATASAEVAQWDLDGSLAASTAHGALTPEFGAPATAAVFGFEEADIGARTTGVASWSAGTMFRVPLSFAPNGGGEYVNRYSLILDVFYPAGTSGWQCLLQTNEENSNDADWCINASNGVGILGNYGGNAADGAWNRLALVVDLVEGTYTSYLNGVEVQQNTGQSFEGRFALGATILLFGDDNGETAGGLVDTIQVWDRALCAEDLAALGGPEDGALSPDFEPSGACVVAPGALRIKAGPYLQWQTQTAMTVMWETSPQADARLVYRRDGGEWLELRDERRVNIHELRLTGLEPAETVEYFVRSSVNGEEVASDRYTLKTAPPDREPFRFTVWGDSQDNPSVFGRLVLDMVERAPSFAVSVGDVVGTGNVYAQWVQQLCTPIFPLARSKPFWVAIGNHEQQSHWFDDYMAQPGNEHWFSFDHGGSHFVILDTNRPFAPGTEQYEWLVDDLFSEAAQESEWLFTFHHHPPFSEIYEETSYAQLRAWIVPLYEEAGVDVNFTGHIHDYERGVFVPPDTGRRIAYVQTSGGGGRLWDDEFDGEYDEIELVIQYVFHYCLLDVNSKRLTLRAIDLNGETIDSFTLDREPRNGEPPIDPPMPEPGEATTQWDFESGDLEPAWGPGRMTYIDGDEGETADLVEFGTTASFGIDAMDGETAQVVRFPKATTNTIGFRVEHAAAANGGGAFVNRFTLVYDLYLPSASFEADGWLGLFNTNATNSNDSDAFVRLSDGGIGIGGQYDGAILPDRWHRVAIVLDVDAGSPVLRKYLDGALVGTQAADAIDGRWSLYSRLDATPWLFILADDDGDATSGFLANFLFTDRAFTTDEIDALGGPSAAGVLPRPCEPDCTDAPLFTRGDVNSDESTDISDAVFLLGFLFLGGEQFPLCEKAGDTDDNGRIELTDALVVLNFLFRGGSPPPAPFGDCGEDPTEDTLSCERHAPCEA